MRLKVEVKVERGVKMKRAMVSVASFAAVLAAGAADMITAMEATNIAEHVVATATNAPSSGAARMLPKYLHYAEFDDCYAADAAAYYERIGGGRDRGEGIGGGCSVLRRGNLVGRNYDWRLDEAAEFVVKVSPLGSRHGSVGVASLGTNLTERMVTSGRHTDLYRVLPGRTVDGINDAGLVAEVNVIPYDAASSPTQGVTRTLHAFGVVRYALDNFGSAREAAEYVAEHYYIPEGSAYAYHWSFSDAEGSWIVEDGRCAKATQGQVMSMSMTNFRIWWVARFIDPETGRIDREALAAEDPYGTGVERFEAMYGMEDVAEALREVAYTKTYLAATEPRRISEFAEEGVARVDEAEALSNVAERVIAAWRGREAARAQGIWWQTVHSSIYDIERRTLAIAVQEDFGTRYVFHADETGERFGKVEACVLAEAARASGVEARIIEEINAFKAFDIRVTDELPEEGEAGVVYLVKAGDYDETKTRDEYLWSQGAWRLIGSTRFDSSRIAKTVTTTPIPDAETNHVFYGKSRTAGGVTMFEDEDGAVQIGKDAKSSIDAEYMATLTNREKTVSLRSEGVAIGHRAFAGAPDSKGRITSGQSVAIGWNARAEQSGAIAIGSGAQHFDETPETGGAAYAKAGTSIAIGYGAKAMASAAVQIGQGRNTTPNSLKFGEVMVVKDGKVQGGGSVDTNEVREIARKTTEETCGTMLEPTVVTNAFDEVTVRSHAITTILPPERIDEIEVTPTGSRNFRLYIPNTQALRESLPIQFKTGMPGDVTKIGPWWTRKVTRLPVMYRVTEPLPKTVFLDVDEYDTGWDWTPVVVRAYEAGGEVKVEGTNLHFTASARIGGAPLAVENPLWGTVRLPTNGVSGVTGELIGEDGLAIAGFTVE